ncbi:hypothetical protein [Rhizobium lentis]|uniref:Uncharacterized protein n=1 Tax=Rhizobium lentis TaxID=1138194 RepID=A0ABS7IGC5_9HYPH|nr:hypothetical protein [Rhizobium lentis]MBX5089386.1 hypothetical protein [Rhizobium lentis]
MSESKQIDWGGSAFPCEGGSDSNLYPDPGMSLRDWFAGQVLSGFMSAKPMHFNPDDDAAYCYRVADAMIAARKAGAS